MDFCHQPKNRGLFFSSSLKYFSFTSIILINTIFFSGYYILKDPLAFILNSEGIPLKEAYSITTSANTLLALSSLFFGFTLHHCGKQKFSLFIGILLSVISIYLLSIKNMHLSMLAITFYVLGGGLYFFNIVIFVNRLFSDQQLRIRGNYLYQIFVNLGAAVGCILFLMNLNTTHVFKYCLISSTISLLIFTMLYKYIEDPDDNNKTNLKKFLSYLVLLFSIIYIALHFESTTRLIVIFSFLAAVIYMFFKAKIESNHLLQLFILLIFLFNIPYWIANTIIFNQFFYFLNKDVTSIHGFTPAALILIDPVANAAFGCSLLLWQRNRIIQHYKNLSYSSLLTGAAFIVLCGGLFFGHAQKISFFYPLIALSFFACAEFLLQTTLNSRIRDLLASQKNNEFLATGMMRSSRAFATILGYYLILISTHTGTVSELHANLHLYSIMALIFGASYLGFYFVKKINLA